MDAARRAARRNDLREKCALITGVTGQDGAYLAKELLGYGYKVVGTFRGDCTSKPNTWRLSELGIADAVTLVPINLLDYGSVESVISDAKPNEIYNLAAQTFVSRSFDEPVYTADINALGTARMLEATRKCAPEARFCQASTSEVFGNGQGGLLDESSPFSPLNPYASAKAYAHWLTVNYRDRFGLFAGCAILFNHESPLRGEQFVTRKISQGLVRLAGGCDTPLQLGNLSARRDWGYAGDFVNGMWRLLQQDTPDDYVFSTGITHSVKDFVEAAARALKFELIWEMSQDQLVSATDQRSGRRLIKISASEMRPADGAILRGNSNKALRQLGWQATVQFEELCRRMVDADRARALSPCVNS